jgi:hypothetical protein
MKTLVEMIRAIEPKLTEVGKPTISKDEWIAAFALLLPDEQARHVSKSFVNLTNLGALVPIKGSKKRFTIRYDVLDAIMEGNINCNPFTLYEDVKASDQLTMEESEVLRRHGLSGPKPTVLKEAGKA